jgi:NlpC/P60 family putative phage cell wall peptidase
MSALEAAEIARSWIGTPYAHQASTRGAGADCLGLLRGVWRELYGGEPEKVPAYTLDWSEPQRVEALWNAARRHLVEKSPEDIQSGDVILFRMREGFVAKHLGIVGQSFPATTFIHSYSGHGVVESALSDPWRRRIAAVFEFPVRRH